MFSESTDENNWMARGYVSIKIKVPGIYGQISVAWVGPLWDLLRLVSLKFCMAWSEHDVGLIVD